MEPNQVEIAFAAKLDEISGQLNQLGKQFESFAQNASSKFGALGGSIDQLIGKVKTLVAGFLSIEGMRRAIVATSEMTEAQRKLAERLAISGAEASVLDVALGDIYSSTEEYAQASQFLTRQLRSNEERLNELGLKTRDANGNLRNQRDMMLDSVAILNQYKQGTDRNTASTEFFGRSASQMQNLLKLNNEVLDKARAKTEELGLAMTVQGKVANDEYKAAMNDLGDVGTAVTKVIGEALMPIVTNFANWMASTGKATVEGFAQAFRVLATIIHGLSAAFRTVMEIAAGAVRVITVGLLTLVEAQQKAFRFDFSGAKDAVKRGGEQIVDIMGDTKKRIEEIGGETGRAIFDVWNPDATKQGGVGKSGAKAYTPAKTGTMAELDTELAQRKSAYERMTTAEGTFLKFSLEMEKQFWREKLQTAKLSAEERRNITKKLQEIEVQEAREALMQGRQLEEMRIESRQNAGLDVIEVERETLRRMQEMGEINAEERLRKERELEERSYQIRRQALEEKIRLEQEDPVKRQAMIDQLEAIDQEHGRRMQKNTTDTAIAVRDKWMEIFGAVTGAFETSIKGMILGTTTFQKAMANIGQAILGEFISMGVKMVTRWIANQIALTAATQAGAAARVATEETAGAAGMASQAGQVITSIWNKAYEAFAGIYAAISGIPIIGPFLAPAMAGAGLLAVGAMAGKVLSARGGLWEVPGDTMAQIHKKEMVLPAPLAEGVRQLVEGGGKQQEETPFVFSPTIMAMDARSVRKLFQREGPAMADALRAQVRNFKGVKS